MIEENKFLEDRKVILKPISKPGGMNPKGHDGEFMYTGTQTQFVLPYNIRKGRLESILSAEEQKFFEKALDTDLNIHRKTDNFWHTFNVMIRKDDKLMTNGVELDLSDPIDNLRYRLLKIQPTVSPSWEKRFERGEYRFALVDEDELTMEQSRKADMKKDAYMFLGKVEDSKKKMIDFLRVYGKRPDSSATKNFLKSEIDKIIEDKKSLVTMLNIIHDENFYMKLFIEDAIDSGAIVRKNKKYYLPGGDLINASDPSLIGTVSQLKKYEKEGDDIFIRMKAQTDSSK